MYKKIVQFKDEKCFGDEIIIFKCKKNFFVILSERGQIVYFFADLELQYLYPANSYIDKIGFEYDMKKENDELNCDFDIDLQKYGRTECPEWIKDLIRNYSIPKS